MIITICILLFLTLLVLVTIVISTSNNALYKETSLEDTSEDLSAYEKGYYAYWSGIDLKNIPGSQAEGWWDAKSEISGIK